MVDIIGLTSKTASPSWLAADEAKTTTPCPYTVTVTLAGNVGTAWATAAVKKLSTAILTDSDGYKITVVAGRNSGKLKTKDETEGGCLLHATSNHVCFRSAKYAAGGKDDPLNGMKATWIKLADYKIGALVAGTEITAAKWGITYTPTCNAVTSPVTAACATFGATADTNSTYGAWWW